MGRIAKRIAKKTSRRQFVFDPAKANRIPMNKVVGEMDLTLLILEGNKRDEEGNLLSLKGILVNKEDGRRMTGYVGFGIDRPFVKENGTKSMDKGAYTLADVCEFPQYEDDDDEEEETVVTKRSGKTVKSNSEDMITGAIERGVALGMQAIAQAQGITLVKPSKKSFSPKTRKSIRRTILGRRSR